MIASLTPLGFISIVVEVKYFFYLFNLLYNLGYELFCKYVLKKREGSEKNFTNQILQ